MTIEGNNLKISIKPYRVGLEYCVYMFVVGKEIVRIGSSKGKLTKRMKDHERDISNRLKGKKSPTSTSEAKEWKQRLATHKIGYVYAREGSLVTTPIGTFNSYLSEESELLGRHQPPLNNSYHR